MKSDTHHLISTMELKKRSEIHWARKLWHMIAVTGMAAFYAVNSHSVSLTVLIVSWLLFVPADFARQRSQALNDFLMQLFRPVMRDSERHRLAGTTYLLTGVLIVTCIFPRDIILLTLLFLAFADPMASFFGIKFGKDKIFGHKSLQGTVAAYFVCAILSFAFLYTHNLMMDRILVVSLLGGLVGALAELIPVGKLDDNLTLPIFSAVFLYALFALFGAFA